MLGIFTTSSDWALKKFLKFALKRSLGRYLQVEPDLDQLDVQLGTGRLELKNLLLNAANVNRDLGQTGWELQTGFVGSATACLPLTSGAGGCSLTVDEVLLTVRPMAAQQLLLQAQAAAAEAAGAAAPLPPQPSKPADAPFSLEDLGLGSASMAETIKRIAGSLESLLQQLQLSATNILVRVELPATGPFPAVSLLLSLSELHLTDKTALARQPAAAAQQQQQQQQGAAAGQPPSGGGISSGSVQVKEITVRGFAVQIAKSEEEAAAAASSSPGAASASNSSGLASSMHAAFDRALAASGLVMSSMDLGTADAPSAGRNTASSLRSSQPPGLDPLCTILGGCGSGGGLDATVLLQLTWPSGGGGGGGGGGNASPGAAQPSVTAEAMLSSCRVGLWPHQLLLLAAAHQGLAAHAAAVAAAAARRQQHQALLAAPMGAAGTASLMLGGTIGVSPDGGAATDDAARASGASGRSFLSDLIGPNCQAFVARTVASVMATPTASLGGDGSNAAVAAHDNTLQASTYDEFQDAQSTFFGSAAGSVLTSAEGVLSHMYQTATSTASFFTAAAATSASVSSAAGTASGRSGVGLVQGAGPLAVMTAGTSFGRQQQPGASSSTSGGSGGGGSSAPPLAPPPRHTVSLHAAEILVTLYYTDLTDGRTAAAAAVGNAGSNMAPLHQQPRLLVSCSGLDVEADWSAGTSLEARAALHSLHAAEHLPASCSFTHQQAPPAVVRASPLESSAAAELARVLDALPAGALFARPPRIASAAPAASLLSPSLRARAAQLNPPSPLPPPPTAYAVAPAAAAGATGSLHVWPVLQFGSAAAPATDGARPSASLRISSTTTTTHGGNGSTTAGPQLSSSTGAHVQLQPLTLWLSNEMFDRLSAFCRPLTATRAAAAEAAVAAAADAQGSAAARQWLPGGVAASAPQQPGSRLPCASASSSGTKVATRAHVQNIIDDILDDLRDVRLQPPTAGSAASSSDSSTWATPGDDLDCSLSIAAVCVIYQLPPIAQAARYNHPIFAPAAPTAGGAGSPSLASHRSPLASIAQQQRQYLAVDLVAAMVPSPVAPPSSMGILGGGGSSRFQLGPSQAQLLPLLRGRRSMRRAGLVSQETSAVDLALAQVRVYLVGSSTSGTDGGGGHAAAAAAAAATVPAAAVPVGRQCQYRATCVLDVQPVRPLGQGPLPGAAAGHHVHGGWGQPAAQQHPQAYSSFNSPPAMGPDDVPPGCGLAVSVTWQPDVKPQPSLPDDAWAFAERHSAPHCADGDGSGWEGEQKASAGGEADDALDALHFRERCRQHSQCFVRVSAPAVSLCLCRPHLQSLVHALQAAGGSGDSSSDAGTDAAATTQRSSAAAIPSPRLEQQYQRQQQDAQQPVVQITTIADVRLMCKLQTAAPPPPDTVAAAQAVAGPALARPPVPRGPATAAHATAFEISAHELSLLHVANLGRQPGASAVHLALEGVTAKAEQPPACLLYCPTAGRGKPGAARPCIELLMVSNVLDASGGPSADPWAAAAAAATAAVSATGGLLPAHVPTVAAPLPPPPAKRSLTSVRLNRVTLSTDFGALALDWATQLAAFFDFPSQQPVAEQPPAGVSSDAAPTAGAAASAGQLSSIVRVSVQEFALRHEPLPYTELASMFQQAPSVSTNPDHQQRPRNGIEAHDNSDARSEADDESGDASTAGRGGGDAPPPLSELSPVAALLLVERAHWDSSEGGAGAGGGEGGGGEAHSVALHSLALHLAMADGRSPQWRPWVPQDASSADLSASGYHRLAQESRVTIAVHPRAPCGNAGHAGQTMLHLAVSNQQLMGMLTPEATALLVQFAVQTGTLASAQAAVAAAAAATAAAASASQPSKAPPGTPIRPTRFASARNGEPVPSSPQAVPSVRIGRPSSRRDDGGSDDGSRSQSPEAAPGSPTLRIWDEILEDAFRPADDASLGAALSASVFVDGGWYARTGGEEGSGGADNADDDEDASACGHPEDNDDDDDNDASTVGSKPAASTAAAAPVPFTIHEAYATSVTLAASGPAAGRRAAFDDSEEDGFEDGVPLEGTWYRDATAAAAAAAGADAAAAPPSNGNSSVSVSNNGTVGVLGAAVIVEDHFAPPPLLLPLLAAGAAGGMAAVDSEPPALVQQLSRHSHGSGRRQASFSSDGAASSIGSGVGGAAAAAAAAAAAGCAQLPAASPLSAAAAAAAEPCPTARIVVSLSGIAALHGRTYDGHGGREGRVEIELDGVALQLENFGAGGPKMRTVYAAVQHFEVRDASVRPKAPPPPGGGALPPGLASAAAAAAAATAAAASSSPSSGASRFAKIVSCRPPDAGQPRDPAQPMAALALDAVRPDAGVTELGQEEYRLIAALLPLRIKLDQSLLSFVDAFARAAAEPIEPALAALNAMASTVFVPMYFQRVEVRPFSLLIDYRPRHVDIGALYEGSFLELLNLVPWGGLDLSLKGVRLLGQRGGDAVAAGLASEWLADVAKTQAHKFVAGVAPINALLRAGSAVAYVLTAPANALSRAPAARTARRALKRSRALRSLRAGSHRLVRALALEALGVGAQAANLLLASPATAAAGGGAAAGCDGRASAVGIKEALRAARDALANSAKTAARSLQCKVAEASRSARAAAGLPGGSATNQQAGEQLQQQHYYWMPAGAAPCTRIIHMHPMPSAPLSSSPPVGAAGDNNSSTGTGSSSDFVDADSGGSLLLTTTPSRSDYFHDSAVVLVDPAKPKAD